MDKVIIYSSQTGNTKKVAYAIKDVVEDCRILTLAEALEEDIILEPIIILGYWVDRANPNRETLDFLERLEGKKIIGFGTLGDYPDSSHALFTQENVEILFGAKNILLGNCLCQGKISASMTEQLELLANESPHFMSRLVLAKTKETATHPNEQDLLTMQQFVINILSKIE